MSHSDTPEQAAVIAWKGERLVVWTDPAPVDDPAL